MANEEHLKILKQGVDVWNRWRNENPEIKPDLSGADLREANLQSANLTYTDFSNANLSYVNISHANFSRSNLINAKLIRTKLDHTILFEANLSYASINFAKITNSTFLSADLSYAKFNSEIINEERPSQPESYFRELDLSEIDLNEEIIYAKEMGTIIEKTNFEDANLFHANLCDVKFNKVNFNYAKLSGAIINEYTGYRKLRGCTVGINGFYSEGTDSAALMTINPPGDSMQGPNPDAIIKSLKQARRLHSFSMSLVGFVLLIFILGLKSITPNFIEENISIENFGLLVMPMSIGLLSIVNLFMTDALKGIRYLNDRKSAMIVGNFPWILSRYAGISRITYNKFPRIPKYNRYSGRTLWKKLKYLLIELIYIFDILVIILDEVRYRWNKYQSLITRLFMIFHPLVYLLYYGKLNIAKILNFHETDIINNLIFLLFFGLLIVLSIWTFTISQHFQKPILFDTQTEKEHQSDIEKLTKAVIEQTSVINKFVDLIKSKKDKNSFN